jgi:hypothetical protein
MSRYSGKLAKFTKNMLYSTYTYRRTRKLKSDDTDWQSINNNSTQF